MTEYTASVVDGRVSVDFDGQDLPLIKEASAYEVIVTPAGEGETTQVDPIAWAGSYEAEDASFTGSGHSINTDTGSTNNVGAFYNSGGANVGGLRTGSDVTINFDVTVPVAGEYDLSVFANALNTFGAVSENGPTNVFVRVNDSSEQEIFLPLGYKWQVRDHAETTVVLEAGLNTVTLAAQSTEGAGATIGDAIVADDDDDADATGDTDGSDAGADAEGSDAANGSDGSGAGPDAADDGDDRRIPGPIDLADLTADKQTLAIQIADGRITGMLDDDRAGDEVVFYVHSEPVLLGAAVLNGNGAATFDLPDLDEGEHHLVALELDGTLAAWNTFEISEEPGSLGQQAVRSRASRSAPEFSH
ncbi:hypothetical protein [Microbacterium amylolyticum]|uniref:CBM6 domain-containing protein n=1 Tax=Microbacterium amylolyticum TaxID=936337 RepID=A0ABS4ZJ97_9MICO|nr:hypothetical protein [Microbacterium amylolyticum]MBP2437369.1 hypothetical protein [Microbacterium amylolyticum]